MFECRELEKIDDEALFRSCDLKESDGALKRTKRSSLGIDSDNRMPGEGSQSLFQGWL
jgi:hypothetical protein